MTEIDWDHHSVNQIIRELKSMPGALLPILHGIQNKLGYIPEGSVPLIAGALNLSKAEVHGVISFYHYFRTVPPGQHTIQICLAESCKSMGSDLLDEHVKKRLGIDHHETTKDGRYSLEPVYCLGNCACSPAIMIDREVFGRVTPDRFDSIIENAQETNT